MKRLFITSLSILALTACQTQRATTSQAGEMQQQKSAEATKPKGAIHETVAPPAPQTIEEVAVQTKEAFQDFKEARKPAIAAGEQPNALDAAADQAVVTPTTPYS
jgi:ABC-type enterochelin transport system substrate-binding protein